MRLHRQGPTSLDPDSFDVKGSIDNLSRAVRRYWLTVVVTTGVTLALVALYIRLYPEVYIGSVAIMAERDHDASRDQFYVDWNIFRKDDLRTEIELMKSGPVAREVVQREKLTYNDVYHPFLSHTIYLWETSVIGRAYRSVKKALLGDDTHGLSPESLEFAKTVGDFAKGISVDPVGESNVGIVSVKGPTRNVAKVTNTLVEIYLAQRSQRHTDEATRSVEALRQQADLARNLLTEVEAERLAFTSANTLAFDFQKETVEVTKLAELEAAIATNQSRLASLESSIRQIDGQLVGMPAMVTTATISQLNGLRENLKLRRVDLQTSLISIRERYQEDAPEVAEIKRSLQNIDELLSREMERVDQSETRGQNRLTDEFQSKRNAFMTELVGIRAGLQVMESTANQLRSRLAQVPALMARLKELDRRVAIAGERFQVLNAKRTQAEVSVATSRAAVSSLRVVDWASPPVQAEWPKSKILYLAALAVGLLLGVSLALMRISLATHVVREDLELSSSGLLPLYGVIELPPATSALRVRRSANGTGNGTGSEQTPARQNGKRVDRKS